MLNSKRFGKVDEAGLEVYFTSSPKSVRHSIMPSETIRSKLGVYDLAGENVDGTYDLSKTKRVSQDPEQTEPKTIDNQLQAWRQRINPLECKEWILINRQLVLIIVVVAICLVIGIGVPLSLLYKTQTDSRADDLFFRPGINASGIAYFSYISLNDDIKNICII